ncbi:MAG: TIGR04086 family membrane protein [Bacilli bacterium]
MIKFLHSIGIFFVSLLSLMFIITLLSYSDILNGNILIIIKFISLIISLIITGIFTGLKSEDKGYIEGLKLGGIITIIIFLYCIIANAFNITDLLYFLIIIGTTTASSIIGINVRKKDV